MPDTYFCHWCDDFIPAPGQGTRAGLFRRYLALAIDPLIGFALYFLGVGVLAGINQDLGIAAAIILPFVYFAWYVALFRKGQTPGKKILGVQVVKQHTGRIPGFGKMFVREAVGKFVSALFFSFGFFAAIFDKNNQAWHDRRADTVVLKAAKQPKAASGARPFTQEQVAARGPAQELSARERQQALPAGSDRSTNNLRGMGQNIGEAASAAAVQTDRGRDASQRSSGRRRQDSHGTGSPRTDSEDGWIGYEYWAQQPER